MAADICKAEARSEKLCNSRSSDDLSPSKLFFSSRACRYSSESPLFLLCSARYHRKKKGKESVVSQVHVNVRLRMTRDFADNLTLRRVITGGDSDELCKSPVERGL